MIFTDKFTQREYVYEVRMSCGHNAKWTSADGWPEYTIAERQRNGGISCPVCNKTQRIVAVNETLTISIHRELINLKYEDGKG